MKSLNIVFTILFGLCCIFSYAQTTYKGVTIDRDRDDVKVIVVKNANSYPVNIRMQYKVGSRDTEWRDYSYSNIRIEANKTERFPVSSKIYGLNLIYVDILQPTVIEQVVEFLGGSGNTNGNNSANSSSNSYSGGSSNTSSSGLNCYKCGGSGTLNGQTCPECGGTGKQTKPVPFPEPEKRY